MVKLFRRSADPEGELHSSGDIEGGRSGLLQAGGWRLQGDGDRPLDEGGSIQGLDTGHCQEGNSSW